ncbi:7992_t:CDS:2, partial [Ambispora leptoticha]
MGMIRNKGSKPGAEELRVLGGHHAKSLLLDKFRQLPFEEKQAKKDELNNLIEKDAYEIGYSWEHLPNHFYRSFLAIASTLIYHWDNFGQIDNFDGEILSASWRIFENFGDIFHCLFDYADYSISRGRVNAFLRLPEKNDNLEVLKNYNRTFIPAKLNRLIGKNGAGKSTVLYLLLGMLVPQKGQIIITDDQGSKYSLHQDINLKYWRENNIAYCAHDTLIEEGSTGQKQLANINQTLEQKKGVQIFCFDEADNALDQDNQEKIQEKIKEL